MAWAAWAGTSAQTPPQTTTTMNMRPRRQEQGWDLMDMESESPA